MYCFYYSIIELRARLIASLNVVSLSSVVNFLLLTKLSDTVKIADAFLDILREEYDKIEEIQEKYPS